jgi:hypothetical protein
VISRGKKGKEEKKVAERKKMKKVMVLGWKQETQQEWSKATSQGLG